ncbi:MAG: ABC transporter permease [Paenibacillaceae bacterium]|uniref:ABC transporter permease n=1 Tax=Paenibacillus mellifer TaxID=2937794 RepID=A0A9X2BT06_9BACL|nr:ABC transporter permease [Paenibacillus mellifer]MBW4838337.1 ABC transporter permease [Paenibacillaceae bacterium]MCK8488975.1 ABC transporter permease [Paenibacillus mellifer]
MKSMTRMTARRLFTRRWRDRFREKLGVLKFTFDWIILLYLGIPGLLLGGRAYYGLWKEGLPVWLTQLPYPFIPIVLLLLLYSSGGISFYIEAADVLFLRQRPRWITGLMLRGLVASAAVQGVMLAAAIAVLCPLMVRVYGMDWADIAGLYAVAYAAKIVQMLIQQLLGVLTTGWRHLLLRSLAYSALAAGFGAWSAWAAAAGAGRPAGLAAGVALSVLALLAAALGWLRFRLRGRFDAEVREEERQRTRLTALLLASAVERPKAPRPGGSKPWLFLRLRRLTRSRQPEARLAEALVKAFFRGSEWKLYAQMTLAGLAAIVLPPYPAVNLIVYAALLLLLLYWLGGHRKAFFDRELMAILPLEESLAYRSAAPAMTLLLLPAVVVLTAALGAKLFPPLWSIPAGAVCGVLIARWLGGMSRGFGLAFGRRPRSG